MKTLAGIIGGVVVLAAAAVLVQSSPQIVPWLLLPIVGGLILFKVMSPQAGATNNLTAIIGGIVGIAVIAALATASPSLLLWALLPAAGIGGYMWWSKQSA